MLNNKFLDKVYEQILSETRIIDNKLYTPFFFSSSLLLLLPLLTSSIPLFSSHCKEVYSLKNEQEIEYVWYEYIKVVTTLIDKKELV